MAPLALHEKVLVSQEFFKTSHAEMTCEQCHGGNPAGAARTEAHKGVVKDPTEVPPFGKAGMIGCSDCHEEQVKTGSTSLHATLSTFPKVLRARAGNDAKNWDSIMEPGRRNHCTACHSSCGDCHVSRPKFAKGGFLRGHVFRKKPDMVNQCMACHGSRVGDEFFGNRGIGDAHLAKKSMDCMACHPAGEMHASGEGLTSSYQLPQMPKCAGCHEKDLGKVAQHKMHAGKVQCQVCHSQEYVNCYSCHTGKDANGVAYFVNQMETESFKIGLAYPGSGRSEKYILVRHVPADREVFDFYGKDAFKTFDNVPTWKATSPHNIQRRTWRSASCNHCHGQRALFLAEGDLLVYEKAANRPVVVPDGKIPVKRKEDTAKDPDVKVQSAMMVTAEALHKALGRKEMLTLVDARAPEAYKKGHIEGAVPFDVMGELRYPADATPRAMTLKAPEELAALFGGKGIDRSLRVVVYDAGGLEAPFLAYALHRLGQANVAVLDGGVDAWAKEAKLPLVAGEPPPAVARKFEPAPNAAILMNNQQVAAAMAEPGTIVLDARTVGQYQGLGWHPLQIQAGHIENAVNLPVMGFWTVEGFLKDPRASAWLLESRGITKDKRIIVTCTTGQAAAGAWWALKYLGYPNVVLHDGSWVSWERSPMMKK